MELGCVSCFQILPKKGCLGKGMISRYPLPLRLTELLEEVPEPAPEGLGVQLRQGNGQGRVPPLRGDGHQAKRVVRGQV